ncbi:uncharacterized protein [Salminus brasiliensis]|uniref:uncharacterized protein n=1 Tax=Salminus brasiliensis TaxID=930266 RepID=UPI003B82D20C
MKRISLVVLILHIFSSPATQAVDTVYGQRSSKLRLLCNEKHADRTVWYGQRCNELPFIIIAVTGSNQPQFNPIFIQGSNLNFDLVWEPKLASFGLTIKNFSDSDQGFYYCSVGEDAYTIIGSGHTVTLEEKVNTPTQPPVTLIVHEENESGQWQRLAIWPIVCLSVSAIALWGIYEIQKQPRLKKQTHCKQHKGVYTTVYFTSS